MRNTFNILFYANRSKERDGHMPILCRITVKGTVAQFSCQMSVPVRLWNPKTGRLKGRSDMALKYNKTLDDIRSRVFEIYQALALRGGVNSASEIKVILLRKRDNETTLLSGLDREIRIISTMVGKDRSASTFNKYKIVRGHCADYLRGALGMRDILLEELDESFLRGFCMYLRDKLNLQRSSVWVYQMPIRKVVNSAYNDGIITRNPLNNFRVSPDVRERGFLTEAQLRHMIAYSYPDGSKLAFTRDLFVFCCMTGLSFADLSKLTMNEIVEFNGARWIVSKRKKTRVQFQAKLLPTAIEILDRHGRVEKGMPLFEVGKYATVNKRLKKIGKDCGVSDNLCFHQARHTFATLALSMGMSMESLKTILGHTDIQTTQIYAKITSAKLDKDYSCMASFRP